MVTATWRRIVSNAALIVPLLIVSSPNVSLTFGEAAQTSSIVLTPDEKTACAVNQDSGSISLWNFSGDTLVKEIEVGDEPRTLAVSPDGRRVYVTNQRSQTLSIVDLAEEKAVATVALGGQPYGVVLSSDGLRAFVSQYAGGYVDGKYCPGTIAAVDLATAKLIRQIPVKARPWAMALTGDGRSLYVTHYLHIDGKGIVTEIDPNEYLVRREIVLEEDDDVGGGGGVFNGLAGIALHPNGRRALVVGMHANARRGLTQSGAPLNHKTTVQAVVRVLDLDKGREVEEARMASSFSGQSVAVPSAVAFLGSGEHFLDLYFASHDLKVIEYNEKGVVAERALLELPDGPTGIAVTRDGRTALVNNRWDRSISQLAVEDASHLRVVKTVKRTAEPWDEQLILGARVFHNTRDTRMTPDRWLSCGTCHLDGAMISDTIVWEFSQKKDSPVLLNTKDLSLSGGTSPPLLANGKFHSVQEEEHFVRGFLQGTGFVDGELDEGEDPTGKSKEMDAVAAYVLSLRPRPNPHMDGDLPRTEIRQAAQRGRELFFDRRVRCASCHRGPNWTRSGTDDPPKLYDVGTGIEGDVPSLRHLWDTAPYLHDGRAKTLLEVRSLCKPGDGHGNTRHLTEQELGDLIQFLLAPYDPAEP